MSDERQILKPYDASEAIGMKEAAGIAGVHTETMKRWVDEFGIGRKVGKSHRKVSGPAVLMLLDGDARALLNYHNGDRHSALVAPYFERWRRLKK